MANNTVDESQNAIQKKIIEYSKSIESGNVELILEPFHNLLDNVVHIYLYNFVVPLVGIILFLYLKLFPRKEKTNRLPTGDIFYELAHPSYKDAGYVFVVEDILCNVFGCTRDELYEKKRVKEIDSSVEDFPEGSTILYCLFIDEQFVDPTKQQRLDKLKTKANVVIFKFRYQTWYDDSRESLYGRIKTLPFSVNKNDVRDEKLCLAHNCSNLPRMTKKDLKEGYNMSLKDLKDIIIE